MRTCCLKLMPGGEPGSEEWGVERGCTQQLHRASMSGAKHSGSVLFSLPGFCLQLAAPYFSYARVPDPSTPQIHSHLSKLLWKLFGRGGTHCIS